MGWVTDQLRRFAETENSGREAASPVADDSATESLWLRLRNGVERDTEEFSHSGGECRFQSLSDEQVRVLNSAARVAALVTADQDANTVEYSYEAEGEDVAVPEKGILTVRRHGASEQLYSADQPVSIEQARKMILQPVFFPDLPSDQAVA